MSKKNLLWVLSVFLLLSAIVYLPQPVSFLFIILACFALPVSAVQSFIKKFLNGKVRIAVIVVLSIVTLFLIPSSSGEADDPSTDETSGSTLNQSVSTPTESTTAPGIDPSATNSATIPLVTEPPVTEPPATEPPITEPPVTEPPVTEPPVTEPPVTEPEEHGIVFIDWPTTIGRNETATVMIQGKPNTTYHIFVYYKSGESTADGLESKTSDANGYVQWSWKIGGRTSPGTFAITVSGGGESASVQYTIVA